MISRPVVGMTVEHCGQRGVISVVLPGCEQAVVRFADPTGYPFPTAAVVHTAELKRLRPESRAAKAVKDSQPAPF
jgi:hypothetical protein